MSKKMRTTYRQSKREWWTTTIENFVLPEGESDLYHVLQESVEFTQKGDRISKHTVQKYRPKVFAQIVPFLASQGVEIFVLHDPSLGTSVASEDMAAKKGESLEEMVDRLANQRMDQLLAKRDAAAKDVIPDKAPVTPKEPKAPKAKATKEPKQEKEPNDPAAEGHGPQSETGKGLEQDDLFAGMGTDDAQGVAGLSRIRNV